MEALLTLNHPDYKLMVYCPSYDKIFKKAQTCMRVKQNDETLYSIGIKMHSLKLMESN